MEEKENFWDVQKMSKIQKKRETEKSTGGGTNWKADSTICDSGNYQYAGKLTL